MKNIRVFLSQNFQFLEVKFSLYLNRRVFVMSKIFLKLRLTCQYDTYLSGFGIHFLGLFCFLYVLLLAKTCASYVSFPNFWGLATLMKFK